MAATSGGASDVIIAAFEINKEEDGVKYADLAVGALRLVNYPPFCLPPI